MIVDDEKIAIDSLQYIIERNFTDIEIVATARSGREAIEKAEYAIPHIIFMDIKMPGINGIQAIKEIKSRHKSVIFIVLTAFDHFDFAKESIELGVFEYLLKPVNRIKVIEILQKAIEMIQTERRNRQVELELKEKLEIVLPILEHGFIYSLIWFEENHKELFNYKELFDIQEDGGYVMTVEFVEEGEFDNKIGYSVRSQGFYPFFRNTMKQVKDCIIGPLMLNRIIVFIPYKDHEDEFKSRLEVVALAEQLWGKLSENINSGFKIGIGKIYEDFELLSSSYEESLQAIKNIEGVGIMHYMDMPNAIPGVSNYPKHIEKIFFQKVSLGESSGSIEIFDHLFDWLITQYSGELLKIKNKLLEIIFLTHRKLWEIEEEEGSKSFFLEEMLSLDDLHELRAWSIRRVKYITKQIYTSRINRAGTLTKNAQEYIDANYTKAITLEDVSREVNVSPQYFSKLFKEETGRNFIDYLTERRMTAAKTLLSQGELTIKEITYQIGYNDPNYFSRIFKKIVGVTPTEYKE